MSPRCTGAKTEDPKSWVSVIPAPLGVNMAAAEEAGRLQVRAGEGRGRRRPSQCTGAGRPESRMEELRFGPCFGG